MPSDSNAVIVGIAVRINSPQLTSSEILFVKLEDGSSDDLLQGQILPNTHFRLGYAFLPNAQPGRYAAIGCRNYTSNQYGSIHSTILFNRALVTKLTRTIAPGTVTLLGNIVVRETIGRQEADFDDVQQHYFRELTGKDIRTALEEKRFFGLQAVVWQGILGSLKQEYPLESASPKFLNILKQGLPTAWKPWFDNSGGPEP